MSLPPFIFIVGSPRSGTTLLRAMFDSHPELAIPPEAHFVRPLLARRPGFESTEGIDGSAMVAFLEQFPMFHRWGLPGPDLRALLQGSPTLAVAFRRLYAAYAALDGKPRYGDKTPSNVLVIDAILAILPEARFIHIIRDGRDVALSSLEFPWGPRTIPLAALSWKRLLRHGCRSGRRLGPERYIEVRYEELVAEPESTIRSLAEFAGLGFRDEMLRYHERQHLPKGTEDGTFPARLRLPPTPGLRDWRRDMAPRDVAVFEALAGDLLDELGYERGSPWSAPAQLRARAHEAAWISRRAARRARGAVRRVARAVRVGAT